MAGIKPATFKEVTDLKQFISLKKNDILQKSLSLNFLSYMQIKMSMFIKEKMVWDSAMELTKRSRSIFVLDKMQIIFHVNDSKFFIMGTDSHKLYSFLGFGDPLARVHPSCHLYLLSYFHPMNLSNTNMFNHYMYFVTVS